MWVEDREAFVGLGRVLGETTEERWKQPEEGQERVGCNEKGSESYARREKLRKVHILNSFGPK